MSNLPTLTHSEWRSLLLPVARTAVERGDFAWILKDHQNDPAQHEIYARIIASYAAADLAQFGHQSWFAMSEVTAAMDARFAELGRIGDECERRAASIIKSIAA